MLRQGAALHVGRVESASGASARWLRSALLAAIVLCPTGAARGQTPARPRDHVEDRARVMERSTAARLDALLTELEQKTGVQLIVLTTPSTGGREISEYALETANKWRLGQAGKDNGVLVVIAVQDRKYWVSVGHGIEGALPDGFCGGVGRQYFRPNFRAGNYSRGIYDGVVALANQAAAEQGVQLTDAPSRPVRKAVAQRRGGASAGRGAMSLCGPVAALLVLIMVVVVVRGFRRERRRYRTWGGGWGSWWMWWLLADALRSSGRRGRWGGGHWGGGLGGGSFGGGGFGGGSFGGGGGGSFGGGGAGGSW